MVKCEDLAIFKPRHLLKLLKTSPHRQIEACDSMRREIGALGKCGFELCTVGLTCPLERWCDVRMPGQVASPDNANKFPDQLITPH